MTMNPFQQVKDLVTIMMLKEVAKENKKEPTQTIEGLANDAYKRLR